MGTWTRETHGTRVVKVYAGLWTLCLILDEPPITLERTWMSSRTYSNTATSRSPRLESYTDVGRHERDQTHFPTILQLTDAASDRMWNCLLKEDIAESRYLSMTTPTTTWEPAAKVVDLYMTATDSTSSSPSLWMHGVTRTPPCPPLGQQEPPTPTWHSPCPATASQSAGRL